MKPYFYLVCVISFSILNFSCQRAVDSESTKISISLPGTAPQNQGAAISQIIDASTKISVLSAGESDNQESENFLDILPTGYSTIGSYPINCYLVAISGPEVFLKNNYCGKQNSALNTLDRTYSFGTFIGLRPAGSTFEFEAVPGDNRQIIIFGLHSTSAQACTDFINKPSKTNFSKPHMVGLSAAMKFEAGKSITVPVNLDMPTATNQMDDCAINNDQQKQIPIANAIAIENRSFPFNVLRDPVSANSGVTCEPFDIQLKNIDPNSNQQNQGVLSVAVNVKITYSQAGSSLDKTLYENAADCANDILSSPTTIIPAGETQHRTWTRFSSGDPTSSDYTPIVTTGSSLQSISQNFQMYHQANQKMYNAILPKQIAPGECLPIKASLLSISGASPISTPSNASFYLEAKNFSETTTLAHVYSDSACANGIAGITMTGFYNSPVFYLKLDANAETIASGLMIKLSEQVANGSLDYKQFIKIATKPANYNPVVSQMRLSVKSHFPTYASGGICIPINIQLMDQAGFAATAPASSTLEYLPAESFITSGIILYDNDSTCLSNAIANNSNLILIGDLANTTLYVRSNSAIPGDLSITLKLNNGIKRKINFTVFNMNY